MRTMVAALSAALMITLVACSKSSPTAPNYGSGGSGSSGNGYNTSAAPDWTKWGFPTVVASTNVTPGTADSIASGPYLVQIPADAFNVPVMFQLLAGDTSTFTAKAPSGDVPVLAFAFRVIDTKNDSLLGLFANPVTVTATDPQITSGSWYYDVTTSGSYIQNTNGETITSGQVVHPARSANYGWVITAPGGSGGTGGGGYGY
ncbi:MAG: hypothetical protein M1339_06140 [Bacteroidetes bacterium]|nr:hypothetical protein [Bacteroidota bacterium]